MRKTITSKLILGYGIFSLIIIVMMLLFIINISLDKIGRAERGILAGINLKVQALWTAAGLLPLEPSQERFASFSAQHAQLVGQVEKVPSLPGGFFLPQRFQARFAGLREEVLGKLQNTYRALLLQWESAEDQEGFSAASPLPAGTRETVGGYLRSVSALQEALESYREESDQFRDHLTDLEIVFFCLLLLSAAAAATSYLFYYLPGVGRDFHKLLSFAQQVAEGNLEEELSWPATREDELGYLLLQLKKLLAVKKAMLLIQEAAGGSTRSISEIEKRVSGIYDSVAKQTGLLEKTSSSFSRITSAMKTVIANATSNVDAAQASGAEIERSTQTIVKGSDDVRLLEAQTRQIEEITALIGDIADQTDLLALNAAIEAARAGEFGKGFNVVALEVQKLADKSARAASEIAELVKSVMGVVGRIAQRSSETNNAMGSIKREINLIAETVGEVLQASACASESIEEINTAIDETMNLTLENMKSADEALGAYRGLRQVVERLLHLVEEGRDLLPLRPVPSRALLAAMAVGEAETAPPLPQAVAIAAVVEEAQPGPAPEGGEEGSEELAELETVED